MPSLAEPFEPPARLMRRRSDNATGKLSRDRLVSMAVLAALLHGLVILGITFAPPPGGKATTDNGIEVLLVSDELPEARENESATYLSQRTQTGSGNTQERLPARIPDARRPGEAGAEATPEQTAATDEQILASTGVRGRARVVALPLQVTAAVIAAEGGESGLSEDEALRLRGERRDELYVTADTRASRLAPYLDAWRRRVERVGTINYPSAAQRQGLTGNPVIEVAIARDGRLQSARIQKPAVTRRSMPLRSTSCDWPARSIRSRRNWDVTTACCALPTNGSSSAVG